MRYIKKFNESLEDNLQNYVNIDDLKEFCEESLVSLIDDEFYIAVKNIPNKKVTIELNKKEGFDWEQIKDQYLSFLDRLLKLYSIEPLVTIELFQILTMSGQKTRFPVGRQHIQINDLESYNDEKKASVGGDLSKIGRITVLINGVK